tara:strand:- start:2209 stop:2550 length:342 start_codon:yes stop_codon:yes gene_type:complete
MLSLTSDGRTSRELQSVRSMKLSMAREGARELYELEALGELRKLSELQKRWHDAERAVIESQQPGGDISRLSDLDHAAHELYREHGKAERAIRPHLQELALSHEEILATVSGR